MNPRAQDAFQRLPARMQRCLRPSLRIATMPAAVGALAIGESRIGGIPDLPRGFEWPTFDGLPLSFIAQFDLRELQGSELDIPLPTSGNLAFFYDSEQRTWGFDPKDRGSAVVAYFLDPAEDLVRTSPPSTLGGDGCFSACRVEFTPEVTLPSFESPFYGERPDREEIDCLHEFDKAMQNGANAPRHRVGGHADCIQAPMERECQLVANGIDLHGPRLSDDQEEMIERMAADFSDWRLLLQVDTDEHTGMMWGDCGMIYFWICQADLAAERFDKSWLILQCS